VNVSAELVADDPPIVVTLTSTAFVSAPFAGETAVIEVDETTLNAVAETAPNLTDVAPVKPVPVMVTDVSPAWGPLFGAIEVTVGAGGSTYVKTSAGLVADVPADVVTVTSTKPLAPAGDTAVKLVAEVTLNDVAGGEPNFTAVAPLNPVPVTVTDVPRQSDLKAALMR
jgi:hypothetical protein